MRKTLTTFLLTTLTLVLSAQSDSEEILGHWSYCGGYGFKYLTLKGDGTFEWYDAGCTGSQQMTGNFVANGDTLLLTDIASGEEFKVLRRNGNLYSYARKDGQYPEFEPLARTTKSTLKKAQNQCQSQRTQTIRKITRRHDKEERKEIKALEKEYSLGLDSLKFSGR